MRWRGGAEPSAGAQTRFWRQQEPLKLSEQWWVGGCPVMTWVGSTPSGGLRPLVDTERLGNREKLGATDPRMFYFMMT